ncbi:MAG: hypothetical protein IPL32_00700 [Chloracidobacterium sp.]|nr:hypothetical protein [Chloracidobacterium sp.]
MDCCSTGAVKANELPLTACQICGEAGRIVAKQTVVHQVISEKLLFVGDAEYRFCGSADCDVVYYSVDGNVFNTDDLRELVTTKTKGDNRPLCYCFGFTEGNVRREIVLKGETTIPAQVTQFIKEKLCACEIRNPSGSCCLGEIKRTAQRVEELYRHAGSEKAIK